MAVGHYKEQLHFRQHITQSFFMFKIVLPNVAAELHS